MDMSKMNDTAFMVFLQTGMAIRDISDFKAGDKVITVGLGYGVREQKGILGDKTDLGVVGDMIADCEAESVLRVVDILDNTTITLSNSYSYYPEYLQIVEKAKD